MAKLVLDIEPAIIDGITKVAERKKVSVSAVVEDLFKQATQHELLADEASSAEKQKVEDEAFLKKIKDIPVSESIKKITGILKGCTDAEIADAKYLYLKEKYGL
ncbi:DUF6364 family protein [Mucilaginibacter sp. CSA2-8R]|uniref:DUF6364 family protein n=1 Tax=Mucilaginibacter sp. CSA2-8R TaxID=3141542 RepID=UPI00315DD01C